MAACHFLVSIARPGRPHSTNVHSSHDQTCIYFMSKDERFISTPTLAESLFIKRWLATPSDLYKAFGQSPSVNDGATPISIIVASIIKSNSICPFSLTVAPLGVVGTEESLAIAGCSLSLLALLISRRAFWLPSPLSLRPFG